LLVNASLFLDLDGTLAEFVSPSAEIRFGDDLHALLEKLSRRLSGRLAIVSGRALDNLIAVVGNDAIELAGSHGLERRRADGSIVAAEPPPELGMLVADVRDFCVGRDLVLEEKPAGVAVHFRDNPGREAEVERFTADAAKKYGMRLQRGSMVREMRAPGWDKGDIVEALMREPPFASGSPVFVGDDLTDEDGFAAAVSLGGSAVLVGEARPTEAQYRLPDVAAVHAWLAGSK
jgi:trehalose 6-phosphate phosphatase